MFLTLILEKACEKGNYKEALKIYEKLSLDENPKAFSGLGYLYENDWSYPE